jgi:hypothetical protein
MHHSDTLVLGPLPVVERSIRLPLASVLIVILLMLLGTGAVVSALARPGGMSLPRVGAQTVESTPVAAGNIRWLTSAPEGVDVVLDDRVVGQTPVEVATAGRTIVLRRPGAPDVRVLDPEEGVAVPVWQQSTMLPIRSPVPGGAITDVTLLEDGRASLIVASPAGPVERQAWILDPAGAGLERVGSALRQEVPPAGVVVAPDGQHRVMLMRGTATANTRATADRLLIDGPEGTRPLLPEGILGGEERVSDLVWAPDGQSALLVTQRPIAGYPPNVSLSRLRQVPLAGAPRNLVDLPVAPLEGSWVWSVDGRNVAFLTRTSPPILATLDVSSGAIRSVADLPAELLPAAGAVAPAVWTTDGTLVFSAPLPQEPAPGVPTSTTAPGTTRPAPAVRLQALPAGRTDSHVLADSAVLPVSPATRVQGGLLALSHAADGTLLLNTLDTRGHLVAEQSLGIQLAGALSVRWDLAHGELMFLRSAVAGGIDLRILRVNGAEAQP